MKNSIKEITGTRPISIRKRTGTMKGYTTVFFKLGTDVSEFREELENLLGEISFFNYDNFCIKN